MGHTETEQKISMSTGLHTTRPKKALLNRKFHTSQNSHHVKNCYQNVTFGKCEVYVWSMGLKYVLKVHIFIFLTHFEEPERFRQTFEELVRFFSDVKI